MLVDEWFRALDRSERKTVLVSLHSVRDVAEGNVPTHRAVQLIKTVWPHLRPLLNALDDDHYQLKLDDGDSRDPAYADDSLGVSDNGSLPASNSGHGGSSPSAPANVPVAKR